MTSCHVLTPVYMDVRSFKLLHDGVLVALGESGPTFDAVNFVVVDDSGGRDPEIQELSNFDDVTVVTPPFNLGHQRAIVVGLRAVADSMEPDDCCVTMDSDGEDRPEDVPRLVSALLRERDSMAVVVARRTRRHATLGFRVLYAGFVLLFRFLTGQTIRSGNFAAFRASFAMTVLAHPSFDLCYSSTLVAIESDPVLVRCPRGRRFAGESRMSPFKLLTHGVHMMMPFADRIAVRALVLSGVLAFLTVASFVVVLVLRLVGVVDMWSWTPWVLASGAIAASLALIVFLVLFTGFVQTSRVSMARIQELVQVRG